MNFDPSRKSISRRIRSYGLHCARLVAISFATIGMAAHVLAAAEPDPFYLSDHPEQILGSRQDFGQLGYNTAAHSADREGEPLRIGDRAFDKGLGHHANGVITVLLEGAYSDFNAEIGLQPCAVGEGSVIFRVVVDGEKKFESPVIRASDKPLAVHVNVAGALAMTLEALSTEDGISCDMANWADARLTPSTGGSAKTEPQVDIGQFGRVVTWDPRRDDGARANRIQEFNADELFLETDLIPDADGRVAVPATDGLACVGLQWLDRRALKEARLHFADPAQVPTDGVRIEAWYGESAWQGKFEPLAGTLSQEGTELVFKVGRAAEAGERTQTRKLRWIFPATQTVTLAEPPRAYSFARWAKTKLIAQIDPAGKQGPAEVAIFNGEFLSSPPRGPIQWKTDAPLPLSLRYQWISLTESDPTVLQFRLADGAFGVAVKDVLEQGAVFVADYGLLVSVDPPPTTIAEMRQKIAERKSILQEVREMPDQTFEQAMAVTHHAAQNEGPVMLSLACDNPKFVVLRDGQVQIPAVAGTDKEVFETVGHMRPQFGEGTAEFVERKLDGNWLPCPVMTFRNGEVTYTQRAFAAPCDEAGSDPARLNRPSVCVNEFTLTNAQAKDAEARLALDFVHRDGENKRFTIAKSPQGWLVSEGDRTLALVIPDAAGLEASVDGGKITLAGKLPANGTAKCNVFLSPHKENLQNLPDVSQLRSGMASYWNAVMAPAMQVETPDPLLNDVILASQVRCLIAARNEADGERIAAWIAAMSYGPLESEAHAVIRAMSFFGHEEFGRRSLDFFIHRYNDAGFLTTGYTTFGTAWHLWTVGEHYQLYRDEAWLRRVADELARVGDWIVRQIDKTSQPAAKGRPEYGLMPPGVLADWNSFAYHFTNNAYYFAGLRELGTLLSQLDDSRGAKFTEAANKLRETTRRAYHATQAKSPVLPLRNGSWVPHYPSQVHSPGPLAKFFPGQDSGRSWCYDVELGAHQLVPTGVFDANSPETEQMLNHMEDVQYLDSGWFDYPAAMNHADWFNNGGFSKVQPFYTRNAEIYAMRDDVKPFIRTYFNGLASLLNTEVLTLWEHFNHSGAWDKTHETAYFLHQTREMVVSERGDELWLAPLITNNWLADGKGLSVAQAPTLFGRVGYRLASHVNDGWIEAQIDPPTRSAPAAIVLRLRHPDGKPMKSVTVNGQPHKDFDPKAETIRIAPVAEKVIAVKANY